MTQDEAVQLDNFLNLLVELNIIEPHESSYSILPETVEEDFYLDKLESESSVIYLEATLEHPNSFEQPHLDNELEKNTPLIANWEPHLNETNQNNSQNTIDAWQKLQELLVGTELTDLNNIAASIQQNLTKLEHQIYDPKELINLLLPSISELLRLKITESKEEIAQIIAPIVDQAIRSRSEEDKTSMGSALASAVPIAITQQILIAPEEVSDAFAPTMGRAIKKQIEIEENVVVAGKVYVQGTVNQIADAKIITQAFEQIPGINFVSSAVQIQKVRVAVRFYFELNSATVISADLENKVKQVKFFLEQHPMKHLKIIGYSYSVTNTILAQQLALARAKAVQQALINQGVEPSRLQVVGTTILPPGKESCDRYSMTILYILIFVL